MTVFIGVYKAIYSYEPQTPEELAIQEDDLLYLLAKSDIDEWWTVKKRLLGSETEEPSGLVPSNYIEEAPVIAHVKATYDYDQAQNPNEELVFHENDTFDVYDDKDPDWVLVKSNVSNEFGFVPGNYVEPIGGDTSAAPVATPAAAAAPVVTTTPAPVSNFLPPPQHNSREDYSTPEPFPEPQHDDNDNNYNDRRDEQEDVPPPKPMRPASSNVMDDHYDDRHDDNRDRARSRVSYYAGDENDYNGGSSSGPAPDRRNTNSNNSRYNDREEEETYDDFYQTWNVQEIDGRKKHKAKLAIGHNRISFIPSKKNSQPQEWTIDKLVSYDHEKKHLFLEFVDPYKNLELHTGNNDKCTEIIGILGEYKGASRGAGIKEIEKASKTKRKGKILFDFIAESQDELSVKTGDVVYIINDKKSSDWWMCENISTGQKGVVPAQFVEPAGPANGKPERSSSGFFNSIKKMAKSANPKSPSKGRSGSSSGGGGFHLSVDSGNWKSDANQDLAEKKSRSKFGSFSHKKKRSSSVSNAKAAAGYGENQSKKAFPDPKKSRMWVDRSGTFKVEAQFIGCAEGKIHLHKSNGVKIAVAADKLSEDDLIYVERVTGFSLEKYKQRGKSSAAGPSSGKDPREQERERRRRIREKEEKERDRRIREKEIMELKKARQLLDDERYRLKEEQDLPPIKPPRPDSHADMGRSASINRSSSTKRNKNDYDWFEFFLNSGVDVSNCQRYTINFDREQITEDMQGDINAAMLRTLGLREGDIVRVMKFLDTKFGREGQAPPTGGMFTQPDGSLKINTDGQPGVNVAQQLLPQATAPVAAVSAPVADDDAWTARPAARSQPNLVANNSEFTGSVQDLLDLEPLTPKKGAAPASAGVPEPNLNNLESVKQESAPAPQITTASTGGPALVPLDPFKTGGNNILPISTSFVMMPFATGGAMLPMQRTGGMVMPQTTFGAQLTGGVLPVQKTANGLIPVATTGGMMPQTTFGAQSTGGLMPLQMTGGLLPLQTTGGLLPMSTTGGLNPMPATSFGLPPAGSVLPVQKTGSGLMPINTTGGLVPLQVTGGAMPQTSFMNNNITGGAIPQTSFVTQLTGGAMPQTSFGNQLTGGANIIPQTTFNNPMVNTLPQTSFGGMQTTGGGMPLQRTGGFQPQSQFGLTLQKTGGIAPLPQTQLTGGVMQQPQLVNQNQFTGAAIQQPQMMGQPQMMNNGVAGIQQGLQNTFISQPQMVQPQQQPMMQPQMTQPQQPMLQTQPTGFGFGNGPQLQQAQSQQQQGQANIMNASVANPFGFA